MKSFSLSVYEVSINKLLKPKQSEARFFTLPFSLAKCGAFELLIKRIKQLNI